MCEHQWTNDPGMRLCGLCSKIRMTVQVFRDGEALAEWVCMIPADSEESAVDYFMACANPQLRYRFLGEYGIVQPLEVM